MAPEAVLFVYPLDGRRLGDVYGPYDDAEQAKADGLPLTGGTDQGAEPLAFRVLLLKPRLTSARVTALGRRGAGGGSA